MVEGSSIVTASAQVDAVVKLGFLGLELPHATGEAKKKKKKNQKSNYIVFCV